MDLKTVAKQASDRGASDFILSAGAPPAFKIRGALAPLEGTPLAADEIVALVQGVLTPGQRTRLEEDRQAGFSVPVAGVCRLRGNAFFQRGTLAACFRVVPLAVPALADLLLPPVLEEIASAPQGLIVVSGPAGHGRSTTQAAILDHVNRQRSAHLLTIEDPVEFIHANRRSVVEQREIGRDVRTVLEALRGALREAPDVLLVEEPRDAETLSLALSAAESGCLVLTSMHAADSVQALAALIDRFPREFHEAARARVAGVLQAVLVQRLIPRKDGSGRIPAVEVLRGLPPVTALLRENRLQQIPALLELNPRGGMRSFDSAIRDLTGRGLIESEQGRGLLKNPLADRS